MVGGGGTAKLVYQNTTTISGTKMYYIRLDVNSGNSTKTEGYYGVGVNNGQCYVITDNNYKNSDTNKKGKRYVYRNNRGYNIYNR